MGRFNPPTLTLDLQIFVRQWQILYLLRGTTRSTLPGTKIECWWKRQSALRDAASSRFIL